MDFAFRVEKRREGVIGETGGRICPDPFWDPLAEAGAEVDIYPLTGIEAEAPLAEPAMEAERETLFLLVKDIFISNFSRSWLV